MKDSTADPAAERTLKARRNLHDGVGWLILGGVILVASLRMDRLESQGINPYTAPGLLPGLLGVAMMCLGALLALRSLGEGALVRHAHRPPVAGEPFGRHRQFILVLALCLVFSGVLLGHGLPFWLAGAIFVSASVLTLQHPQRQAAQTPLGWREIATAVSIGLGAGWAIALVFQSIFLVRLP